MVQCIITQESSVSHNSSLWNKVKSLGNLLVVQYIITQESSVSHNGSLWNKVKSLGNLLVVQYIITTGVQCISQWFTME